MNKHGERIAFFIFYMHPLKLSPAIMNSAIMWANKGVNVDIYKCKSGEEGVNHPLINIIHATESVKTFNPFKRLFYVFRFIKNCYKSTRNKNYLGLIGFDSYGLIISGILGLAFKKKFVYYSLEILTPAIYKLTSKNKILQWLHYITLKKCEIFFHKRALFTVIQDYKRAELLFKFTGINPQNIFFVPNAPLKEAIPCPPSNYLREKFFIKDSQKIVLYAGQINDGIGLKELVGFVNLWPSDCVFVIHGFGPKKYLDQILALSKKNPNVILSQNLFNEGEYNAMIRSADIGLIWRIDRDNENSFVMGAASGKMFYYLKSGLPIISNKLPGLLEIVGETQCGICVDNEAEISKAIPHILKNYSFYQKNAYRCYEQYDFSTHYNKVMTELIKKTKNETFYEKE